MKRKKEIFFVTYLLSFGTKVSINSFENGDLSGVAGSFRPIDLLIELTKLTITSPGEFCDVEDK